MGKKKYRITNWTEYNKALKQRGALTVWMEKGFEKLWYAVKTVKRGRPFIYSEACMKLIGTVRHIFKLALRQLEGFLSSLFDMFKVKLRVPEFSRFSRRMVGALSNIKFPSPDENIHIVIDSSGLKVYGEKEWIETKKGKKYSRKVWQKIHIGIDGKGNIKASKMTSHKTDDRACFSDLIDQAGSIFIDEVLADSGYDSHNSYHQCHQRNINTIIPPPKNARISRTRKNASEERNRTIKYINEKGIYAWKAKNNYGRRNRVENTFYRIKTIFGRQFSSRTWERQEVESRLICDLLNKMTSLGMPDSVKVG